MGTHAQPASREQSVPYVARQPILDGDEKVLGYELVFQRSPQARGFATDVESETCAIIDTLNVIGLGVLCDGRRAFIDCTHQMLLVEYFALLPPGIVIEIQDSVPSDEPVVALCQRLKHEGYMMALDNFAPHDAREPLAPYADFIKIDIKKVSPAESAALTKRYGNQHCRMLAQKVDTRQDLVTAQKSGFTAFQGGFFRQAEHVRARHIPANQATYLRLLQAISKSELNFTEIEDLIKHEPSLCYRLLRYLNSASWGLSAPLLSIRQAFNLMGERELVRWIRMASIMAVGQEKCSDLVLSSLVRARFCELIAPKLKHGQSDLYLMGMLSLMDAILEVPIGVVIEELPIDPDTKAQLLCRKTGNRTSLSSIYDLMVAREAGDWGKVTALGKSLDLSLVFVAASYNEAMRWAGQLTSAVRIQPPQGH
jgi:c-di-GMP-related signal transduction protein